MLFSTSTLAVVATLVSSALGVAVGTPTRFEKRGCPSAVPSSSDTVRKPKVFIITMFSYERAVWIEPLKLSYTVAPKLVGLSPLYPDVLCNHNGEICLFTTGESEINAATSVMSLLLSRQFDFTSTYFFITGIAGINPYHGTLGTAAFARFAIQVALEYEIDGRQIPSNWTTGYWALGTSQPGELPATSDLYGTEVFEVNTNLLAKVLSLTSGVTLNDSATAQTYRSTFNYAPANLPPKVTSCDVATSDVYYAGTLLSESFGNYSALMTGGEAVYCMTAQEDNASLEAMTRAAKVGLMDFSRVIVLRTGSDFDRAPPGVDAYTAFEASQGGFEPALQNLVIAGTPVVADILKNWESEYKYGIATQSQADGSYYGDDLGTIREGVAQARARERRMVA